MAEKKKGKPKENPKCRKCGNPGFGVTKDGGICWSCVIKKMSDSE